MSSIALQMAGPERNTFEEEKSISEKLQPFVQKFPELKEKFQFVAETFVYNKEFEYPRDIYPVYSALNTLSDTIGKTDKKEEFKSFITNSLDGFVFQRTGLGSTYFTTSSAEQILDRGLQKYIKNFAYEKLDLNRGLTRTKAIEYIQKVDAEAFGNCFKTGFLDSILQSPDTVCFAYQDEQSMELKGICWGFFATHDTHELFHCWELSRLPSEPSMQIGDKEFKFIKKELSEIKPNLEFITLNVDKSNFSAKKLYSENGFTDLMPDQDEKIFMVCDLKPESKKLALDESVKTVVKDFVMKSVPLPKLVCCELARKCELLFRSYLYRWL